MLRVVADVEIRKPVAREVRHREVEAVARLDREARVGGAIAEGAIAEVLEHAIGRRRQAAGPREHVDSLEPRRTGRRLRIELEVVRLAEIEIAV